MKQNIIYPFQDVIELNACSIAGYTCEVSFDPEYSCYNPKSKNFLKVECNRNSKH